MFWISNPCHTSPTCVALLVVWRRYYWYRTPCTKFQQFAFEKKHLSCFNKICHWQKVLQPRVSFVVTHTKLTNNDSKLVKIWKRKKSFSKKKRTRDVVACFTNVTFHINKSCPRVRSIQQIVMPINTRVIQLPKYLSYRIINVPQVARYLLPNGRCTLFHSMQKWYSLFR